MMHSLKITWLFALTQMKRSFRDPVTLIVLFGIPVLLVLIFGSITKGSEHLSVDVAVVNKSRTAFAKEFEQSLGKVQSLKLPDEKLSLAEARDEMNNDALDGIVELPANFGELRDGVPTGAVRVYFDQTDQQTGDIVASIIQGITTQTNKQLVQTPTPLEVVRTPLKVTQASAFDNIYAIFTGMAIMMVGVFAVASTFPADKKSGVLRRMHATPIKAREVIGGTMISYLVVGLIGVVILTTIALGLYDFSMRGSWLTYAVFILISLITMLGFGLAIGGIAKNTTQADILGQIIFLASLAVSGVWFPRVLMPEFLQNITAFLPLTPVIDGIRAITTENATLVTLLPEMGILTGWALIVYILGARLFRWQ